MIATAFAIGIARGDSGPPHHAPVLIKIYYRDGVKREAILVAQSPFVNSDSKPEMIFHTSTGDVTLYMDTISTMSDVYWADHPDNSSALFKFANGSSRRLKFGRFSE